VITNHMSEQDQNKELFDRWMYGINTCIPGIVQEFYPETQTATIMPAIQAKVTGYDGKVTYQDAPALLGVPVCFPFAIGAGFAMTWPIRKDDPCVIVFSQRGIDNWHEKGGVQPPEDSVLSRHHDINDAFAMIGAPALTQTLTEWLSDGIELRNTARTTRLTVLDDRTESVAGSNSVVTSGSGTEVKGSVKTDSNLSVGSGWSGVLVDVLGTVVTVQDGVIVGGSQ